MRWREEASILGRVTGKLGVSEIGTKGEDGGVFDKVFFGTSC